MSDITEHYILAVKAPDLDLAALRGGLWVIMANKADPAELEPWKLSAVHCLTPFNGQIAVFRFPVGQPKDARMVWSHNVSEVPEFEHLTSPQPDQREAFWFYTDRVLQQAAAATANQSTMITLPRGGSGLEKPKNTVKWWLWIAAAIFGMMAYAVSPEFFRDFNWRGQAYDTSSHVSIR